MAKQECDFLFEQVPLGSSNFSQAALCNLFCITYLHTFLLVCTPLPEPCPEPDASLTRTVLGRRSCVLPLDPELDVLGICFSNEELPWRREITRV
jgi:hypothetical protein